MAVSSFPWRYAVSTGSLYHVIWDDDRNIVARVHKEEDAKLMTIAPELLSKIEELGLQDKFKTILDKLTD